MRLLAILNVCFTVLLAEKFGPAKYLGDILKIFNHGVFDMKKFTGNMEMGKPGLKLSELTFYLSTRKQSYVDITKNTALINQNLKIKMLVHGWTEHADVVWCKNATSAYLRKKDFNIIAVDWSAIGDNDYLTASSNVYRVGATIGDWIVNVHEKHKIPLEDFHLISHSLGCQVSSYIGKRVFSSTQRKIGRITALDPAAPIFDMMGPEKRLYKDDALFVDIVHTDGGMLGFRYPIGHADFYPNGGNAIQSGCSLFKPDIKYEDLFCSHAKSHHFFIETINAKLGHGRDCASWADFTRNVCSPNNSIVFGEYASSDVQGVFYLKTDPDGISLE